MDFSALTEDHIRHECFKPAYALYKNGVSTSFRQNAWTRLLELSRARHDYNPDKLEQTRELKRRFFKLSPSPAPMIQTKILAGRDAGWSHTHTLRSLYEDAELDLIDGEGHHWMKVCTEKYEIQWPNVSEKTQEGPLNPKEEFYRLLHQCYDDPAISRKQAWDETKRLLEPEPLGLFIANWPFTEVEFREIAQSVEDGSRLDIWDALVDEMIITPGDPKELRAFRSVFFRISPTPEELVTEITKGKTEMSWDRPGVKEELEHRLGDQLIPGELDYQFDRLWPV